MIRFQADADLDRRIVETLWRREPALDIVTAEESRLHGMPDPQVLDYSASVGRVLITHDKSTMPEHFADRVRSGMSCPGVLVASKRAPIAEIAESIVLIWSASEPAEWEAQVRHLPNLDHHSFKAR